MTARPPPRLGLICDYDPTEQMPLYTQATLGSAPHA